MQFDLVLGDRLLGEGASDGDALRQHARRSATHLQPQWSMRGETERLRLKINERPVKLTRTFFAVC
jgi:hypothetical protein